MESETLKSTLKLLVWDLDNTLWKGTLLEGDDVVLGNRTRETLATLDRRGILFSVASKNDSDAASHKLRELQILDYFLYPQISWRSKAASISAIVKKLNIGMEATAFIDDDDFEREEVKCSCPGVTVFAASDSDTLADREVFLPQFVTQESTQRRQLYLADLKRQELEQEFVGPNEAFLASLGMKLIISKAGESDLQRAEELTRRTNQLNTTGYTFSYEELNEIRLSRGNLLLMATLDDKFGPYGKVGLVLVERSSVCWTIRLLLVSCRVMTRGIGTAMINHLLLLARELGIRLRGEFRPNGVNRMMLMAYKFTGFKEVECAGDSIVFEHDLRSIQGVPHWIELHNPDKELIFQESTSRLP